MSGNSFGRIFSLTSFGESHGVAIGGIIDGCPAGIIIDYDFIQSELDRRKPGQSNITSQRKENDRIELLSGIFEKKTTGAPIAFIIKNKDHKPADYEKLKDFYRPSHADYTYEKKFEIRDYRGGGRASARETIARVVAGAFAKMVLKKINIEIKAYVSAIADIVLEVPYNELDLNKIESNIVRCPDQDIAEKMINKIERIKEEGDSLGGIINCVISNTPPGLGSPVFDKLHAELGKAMLSINAVKGFEIGSGFSGTSMKGSQHNDKYIMLDGKISTYSNNSGGIQGGISNGQDILLRIAFKPTPTIYIDQETIDNEGKKIIYKAEGRHDPCVVPRAVPIVEAMAAIVILDQYLINKTVHL
ncbi:chorismate synthase [Bacteroidota bacterium]